MTKYQLRFYIENVIHVVMTAVRDHKSWGCYISFFGKREEDEEKEKKGKKMSKRKNGGDHY